MGLLSQGTPLDWTESRLLNEHVRKNGIEQLLSIFAQHQSRKQDPFLWGDEVEYMLVDVDDEHHTAKLSIDHDHVLDTLNDPLKLLPLALHHNVTFHPEYGRYMLEGTPAKPYDGQSLADYSYVEENMRMRRVISELELPKHIVPLTLTTFPRMGCPGFTSPNALPIGPALQSLFLPDEIINRHVRFPTLTANIRKRRGSKVAINLPMYPDKNTKLLDDSIVKRDLFKSDREPFLGASIPGHVYMDSMGFGMGLSCLQVTMQPCDIDESRYLYDMLAPLTPLMLSLSAAAPIFKGYLVNQDVRWNVISGLVDDRTFVERGVEPFEGYHLFGGLDVDHHHPCIVGDCDSSLVGKDGTLACNVCTRDGQPVRRIPKSRYDLIDLYLGGSKDFLPAYNDIEPPINASVLKKLLENGIDEPLARHFAHLFVRDPLVVFSEREHQDNSLDNDHFENLQLTNWQTLRFKPPAPKPEGMADATNVGPGWRVEFRPMEIQLTDFENAAYLAFVVLVSRAIIMFKPNWYIPISKIESNMKTAHKVDLAIKDKFWFKLMDHWDLNVDDFQGYDFSWFDRYCNDGNDEMKGCVYLKGLGRERECTGQIQLNNINDSDCGGQFHRYTAHQLVNGTLDFPGLILLVIRVVATDLVNEESTHHCSSQTVQRELQQLKHYLMLISQRASGEIPTTARWLRDYVLRSDQYNQDLKVNDELNYRLVKRAQKVSEMDPEAIKEFLGDTVGGFMNAKPKGEAGLQMNGHK